VLKATSNLALSAVATQRTQSEYIVRIETVMAPSRRMILLTPSNVIAMAQAS